LIASIKKKKKKLKKKKRKEKEKEEEHILSFFLSFFNQD